MTCLKQQEDSQAQGFSKSPQSCLDAALGGEEGAAVTGTALPRDGDFPPHSCGWGGGVSLPYTL